VKGFNIVQVFHMQPGRAIMGFDDNPVRMGSGNFAIGREPWGRLARRTGINHSSEVTPDLEFA